MKNSIRLCFLILFIFFSKVISGFSYFYERILKDTICCSGTPFIQILCGTLRWSFVGLGRTELELETKWENYISANVAQSHHIHIRIWWMMSIQVHSLLYICFVLCCQYIVDETKLTFHVRRRSLRNLILLLSRCPFITYSVCIFINCHSFLAFEYLTKVGLLWNFYILVIN